VAASEGDVLSTREAAAALGISPQRVRKMISDGRLPARRSSAGWLITRNAVVERRVDPSVGRPVHPRTAWAAIAMLDAATDSTGHVPPSGFVTDRRLRHRVLKILSLLPDPTHNGAPWRSMLARRARARRMWVHPGLLDRLAADPRVSGSGAIDANEGLSGGRSGLELYIAQERLPAVVAQYRLGDDDDGQILLRAVPVDVPAALAPRWGERVSPATTAADLLDEDDPRARDAAQRQLGLMQRALLSRVEAGAQSRHASEPA
jgi:excisionase family DNA binding protein